MRFFSILMIWIGFCAMVALSFVRAIADLIFSRSPDGAIGYAILLALVSMVATLGVIGVGMFEAVRFAGIERRGKEQQA